MTNNTTPDKVEKENKDDVFEMYVPSLLEEYLSSLNSVTINLEEVKNIKKTLNRELSNIKKKECVLLEKENKLNDALLKLEDKHDEHEDYDHLAEEYSSLTDIYNNLICKYDVLLQECLKYKEAYRELEGLIHEKSKEDDQ